MSIQNDTLSTVNYQVKWAHGGWNNFRLEPGESRMHYWVYDYANQNRSPRPLVRFDENLTAGARWRKHTLQPYAAPGPEYLWSRVYSFTAAGGTLRMLSLT